MSSFLSPQFGAVAPLDRYTHHHGTLHGLKLTFSGGVPVLPPPSVRATLRDGVKRGLDVVGSTAALIMLAPILIVLAVAVKLSSPGPAFFKQWRTGRHGEPFQIYKFRTLRCEAADAAGVHQVGVNDPRVTPIGAFLRAKSLDELPQLLNVLRGDMSLVGPRPHPIGMMAAGMPYEQLVPYYALRQIVRPGLSGWAQVNGLRGPTTDSKSARDRIDHDIAYIQNHTIGLDLKVIMRTIKNEFLTGSGV